MATGRFAVQAAAAGLRRCGNVIRNRRAGVLVRVVLHGHQFDAAAMGANEIGRDGEAES